MKGNKKASSDPMSNTAESELAVSIAFACPSVFFLYSFLSWSIT